MSGYDESKDKVLGFRVLTKEGDDTGSGYEVKLCRYDGGDIKVQINPFYTKDGEKRYNKLGRISYEWFVKIAVAVKEIYDEVKG